VTAGNELLATQPELVNSDPYGRGWILRIKPAAGGATAALLDADGYNADVAAGG